MSIPNLALMIMFSFMVLPSSTLAQSEFSRKSFPSGFVFGTASSAFQYEGAVKEDGRGPSVWDIYSHRFGRVVDSSNADVAVDQYHRYKVRKLRSSYAVETHLNSLSKKFSQCTVRDPLQ